MIPDELPFPCQIFSLKQKSPFFLPPTPTFSFLSANTDCVNSQDQTIMVFHRDLSGLMLYLRMKVAKQSPPFLGVVALSVKRFGQRLPKRLDHLGSRCLVEEATVVPDEQKIKMECS